VFEDAEAEKQAVSEMLKAASEFVTAWFPIIQAQPALLDMAFEMLAFALRRFKTGRSLEEVIEQTKLKLQQAAQQPKPPDPKMQVEQAKLQAQFSRRRRLTRRRSRQKAQPTRPSCRWNAGAQQKHQLELQKMHGRDTDAARRNEHDPGKARHGIASPTAKVDGTSAGRRAHGAWHGDADQAPGGVRGDGREGPAGEEAKGERDDRVRLSLNGRLVEKSKAPPFGGVFHYSDIKPFVTQDGKEITSRSAFAPMSKLTASNKSATTWRATPLSCGARSMENHDDLAVDVYKNGIKLGSGTATAASATISSYGSGCRAIPRPAGMFRSLRLPATTSAQR
jgi:hypothetical protein